MSYHGNWLSERIQSSRKHQDDIWDKGLNDFSFVTRRKNRILTDKHGKDYVDFMSCSYLGLDIHPDVIKAAKESVDLYGVQYATARTRAKADLFDSLEEKLNTIFKSSSCVVFNAVGTCHNTVLPLLGSGELPGYETSQNPVSWIVDKTCHATIQSLRGILEQFGTFKRVSFNDLSSVQSELEKSQLSQQTPILISDSLNSMGGAVDVKSLSDLAAKYSGYFYIDDAHGTSIVGDKGCGYALYKLGEFPEHIILVSSLSKAFGTHGGAVSFKKKEAVRCVKRYGVNYIFSGPPCLAGMAACYASSKIHLSHKFASIQSALHNNLSYFDDKVQGVEVKEKLSPIRTILIGKEEKAIDVAIRLREKGYLTTAAIFPTVPKGKSIIRIALASDHTKEQIDKFSRLIIELS